MIKTQKQTRGCLQKCSKKIKLFHVRNKERNQPLLESIVNVVILQIIMNNEWDAINLGT